MKNGTDQNGFTVMELLVVTALFAVISVAGFMLFNEGQTITSVTMARMDLQEDMRELSQRLVLELQESGEDENGVMQVTILDNTGVNGTDVLRFSVPICPCGVLAIDPNGDTKYWGAPLFWGQSGCNSPYIVSGGFVNICHVPGVGLPADMSVPENEVKAHLAHGDRLGACASCDPDTYTNRTVEYMVDANARLLRRVLDAGGAVIASTPMGENFEDFQAVFGAGQDSVTISAQLEKTAVHNRLISLSGNWNVRLRNKD